MANQFDDVAVIQKETLFAIGDAIIDTTGRTEDFKVRDYPRLIREEVYQKGYDNGFADGEASGGGGGGAEFDYIAYWDEMLGNNYTEVQGGTVYDDETDEPHFYAPTSVLARSEYGACVIIPQGNLVENYNAPFDLVVIPRSITSIGEMAFDDAPYSIVVCLAPTPPTLGWQGMWSSDGGFNPPSAIYVLDSSVDAYKADTAWAEYAGFIMPISEFEYFVTG